MENLVHELTEKGLTLGSIESMTGGIFASKITDVPGASKVFKGTVVPYSAQIKNSVVGVLKETIQKYGVVSEQVAYEMASKGRTLLGVDVCVSVTGNAGPTAEPGGKKVGVFYVAVATKYGVRVKEYKKTGNRNDIRNMAVLAMRDLVHLEII